MNNETPIKELDDYARLHNLSWIVNKGRIGGYRNMDYVVDKNG